MITTLNNTGLITKTVPDELFNDLKRQVALDTLKPMISGVSDNNVANHYYLENPDPLKQFVLNIAIEYINAFSPAIEYKIRSNHEGGVSPTKLYALEPWCNKQLKNQWIPCHSHCGLIAYSLWVNIPEDNMFEFIYTTITGDTMKHFVPVTKQSEGTIMLFPSKLMHTVYPFYNSEETRIAISGNITLR